MLAFRKIKDKKIISVVIVIILLVATPMLFRGLHMKKLNVKQCSSEYNKAINLLTKKEYQKAYNEMKPYEHMCSDLDAVSKPDLPKAQQTMVNFEIEFARAAYTLSKYQEARAAATKALNIYNKLTNSQRATLSNQKYSINIATQIYTLTDPALLKSN